MKRFKKFERKIFNESSLYQALPDDVDLSSPVRKKREINLKRYCPSASSADDHTPKKTNYVIVISDSDSDQEDVNQELDEDSD